MEKDAECMVQELKQLKETIKVLNSEKIDLENHNHALLENEIVLADKYNNIVIQLEKKQETLTELEALGVKLKAEIQPLEYMKDNLEKKITAFKECNKIQSERISCLENINKELLDNCEYLKNNQVDVNEIKSLQHDNWALKKELLNIEKFKDEVTEKIEKLKNDYEVMKNKNLALVDEIENLKLDKNLLKSELEKNEELHSLELIGYQNLLTEEQNKKHHINMDILKTIEELTNQTSEQQKLMSGIIDNKESEVTCTVSDFSLENTISTLPKNNAINILETDLEHQKQQQIELQREIENKNSEIEHLNYIKQFQEEKIIDYRKRIQDELDRNTELELNDIKLKNNIKVLENKIYLFKTKEVDQANDGLKIEELSKELESVLDTNDLLDKELNRILDIKEETDQKLIEAYQQISDLKMVKSETAVLLEELESKNKLIETLKLHLENAQTSINNGQVKYDEDKRLVELKILDYQKQLKEGDRKYKEIVNNYDIMKKYVIQRQPSNEHSIIEKNDDLAIKLKNAEKNTTEWQEKYNALLWENRDINFKFESLDAECGHLKNRITELQNKLVLSDHYKNILKNDIEDITKPADLVLKNSKLIVKLETENASLTKKLLDTRQKYNKCRAHLEEIKTMLTKHNLKNVVQENIVLCNTRDDLQKEINDLKSRYEDLRKKLMEKDSNCLPAISNQPITRIEALYHSLVWQKMYLVKLARGKDKLLRFIIQEWPDLDNSIVKTMIQKICAKRKISKFKIAVLCLIAARRMQIITVKHPQPQLDYTQPQLNLTHYSLPKKMPWIKC